MKQRVLSLWVFIAIFAVYAVTVAPSVAGGDSGELLAEACQLGTAHPPGYPLFTILMHLVMRLPPDGWTKAAWANLASAFFGAVAASGLAWCLLEIWPSATSGSAVVAAGLYAFSPLVWQYSTTAEVFALNNALNALILCCAVAFVQRKNIKFARCGAFLCGLALCNQHTAVLFEVPLISWMMWILRKDLFAVLPSLAAFFCLGLTPYLYLPLAKPKQGSWGNVHSVTGFFHHFLRRDYGTLRLYSGATKANDTTFQRVRIYIKDVATRQSNPHYTLLILAAVAFLGLAFKSLQKANKNTVTPLQDTVKSSKQRRKSRLRAYSENKRNGHDKSSSIQSIEADDESSPLPQVAMPLFITYVFYVFLFHSLSNLPLDDPLLYGVHARFWMQPNLILCLFAGLGLEFLVGAGSGLIGPKHRSAGPLAFLLIATQLQLGIRPGGAPGSVLLAGVRKALHLESSMAPPAWHFHDYARALLAPLPKGSLLLVNYDQQWTSIRYQQLCENFRTDVTVLQLSMMTYGWWEKRRSLYPNVHWPGTHYTKELTEDWAYRGGFTIKEFLDANYAHFSSNVFLGGKLSYADKDYKEIYELVPHGLMAKVIAKKTQSQSLDAYVKSTRKVWNITLSQFAQHGIPIDTTHSQETWEWTINRELFDHIAERAAYILERAISEAESSPTPTDHSLLKKKVHNLLEAAIWLEYCIQYDTHLSTSAVKNSGLADVHIVQTPTLTKLPHVTDLFQQYKILAGPDTQMRTFTEIYPQALTSNYKTWASERFMVAWANFLQRDDAKNDPQYDTIRQIYSTVTSSAASSSSKTSTTATTTTAATRKRK